MVKLLPLLSELYPELLQFKKLRGVGSYPHIVLNPAQTQGPFVPFHAPLWFCCHHEVKVMLIAGAGPLWI